jgi:hypothetical protein
MNHHLFSRVNNVTRLFGCILLSFVYAGFVYTSYGDSILDSANYFNYAANSYYILQALLSKGWNSIIFGEPIWLWINTLISQIQSPADQVKLIASTSAFILSLVFLNSFPGGLLIAAAYLLFPGIVKNFFIHVRQGLAIAVFMIGFFSSIRYIRYLMLGIAPLIHSSFFIVYYAYALSLLIRYISNNFKIAKQVFVGIAQFASGLLFGLASYYYASFSGVRQIDAYFFGDQLDIGKGSGVGFVAWLVVYLIIAYCIGRNLSVFCQLPYSVMGFYLGSYFVFSPVSRVFEDILPIYFVMLQYMRPDIRRILNVTSLVLAFIYYLQRLSQPCFGLCV